MVSPRPPQVQSRFLATISQFDPFGAFCERLHQCRHGFVWSLCCSVGLCPGGGSTGRPPEAGESMHDGKEGELKQEEGFFSKLKKLFSSS